MRRFWLVLLFAIVLVSSALAPAANAATSAIDNRYWAESALRSILGPPTGNEYSVANGRIRWYKWGNLYWSPSTGVHEVHGAIRHRYHQLGGPTGFLGFPTTDEGRLYFKEDIPEQRLGSRSDFQGGAISWTSSTGAKWMSKTFADAVPYYSFPDMGIPIKDEHQAKSGRVVELGTQARLYKISTGGLQILTAGYPSGSKDILRKYVALGGHDGFLGLPRSGGSTGSTEGIVQRFDGGDIYQCGYLLGECSVTEAHEVHGAIRWRFNLEGGVDTLGYPTSDEQPAPQGRISHFQNGSVYWNASTGETTVDWN